MEFWVQIKNGKNIENSIDFCHSFIPHLPVARLFAISPELCRLETQSFHPQDVTVEDRKQQITFHDGATHAYISHDERKVLCMSNLCVLSLTSPEVLHQG